MALVSLAGTGTGSAPTPSRAAAWQHVRHLPAALLSGVLSVLAFALATRLSPADMALPWGRGDRDSGDAAYLYNYANTMIREGWFSYNPSLGFPVGMDAAGIQQAELHQWAELWFITRIVADPLVALNTFYVLGFFAVGFCAYLLFRATLATAWLSVALSVAAATVPWHFARFHHALLADYSAVPVFLLLAFLMWRGWWRTSRPALIWGVLGAAYVGTSGVYYAFFACLALAPILLAKAWSTRSPRLWWRDALITATIPATLGLSLLAHRLGAVIDPVGAGLPARTPGMSLTLAGDPSTALLPWPLRDNPLESSAQFGIATSAAFAAALILVIGYVFGKDRRAWAPILKPRELEPWPGMLVWLILWWLPGLGLLFAVLVSPDIRAWGRLSVAIMFVSLIICGIAIRGLIRSRPGARPAVTAAVLILVVAPLGWSHRPLLIPESSLVLQTELQDYASGVEAAVSPGCAILQLPVMEFPEDWRFADMAAYDHFWVTLVAPEQRWSFGIVTGSGEHAAVREVYDITTPIPSLVQAARSDGYCGIHADSAGLSPADHTLLVQELGSPSVATERWSFFAL